MKQSSIEWYVEQVNILDYRYNGKIISLGEYVNEKNIIELKAKQMHKQEIIEAHEEGVERDYHGESEQYYKNTYETTK